MLCYAVIDAVFVYYLIENNNNMFLLLVRELKTVGLANIASGLCGGFTGSYIFSQTIFCMRRGISTKLCGIVVALSELIIIVLPIPITCYIPKMFFGSILIMISIDLMIEWLVSALQYYKYVVGCVCTVAGLLAIV